MTAHNPNMSLSDVLASISQQTAGEHVTFGEILETFGSRAFGPILLIPALIAVLPTGAIPGMSLLTGSIIALVAVQLLVMRPSPWLPRKLTAWSFPRDKLVASLEAARPYTSWIDRFLRPRWTVLLDQPFSQISALICLTMALSMFPLALLPFAVAIPGISVALIALGMTARDGVLLVVGYVFAAVAIGVTLYAFGAILIPVAI